MGQSSSIESNIIDNLDPESKAESLLAEATKLSQTKSIFDFWTDSDDRFDSIIDLFKRSSNYYKIVGLHSKAGYALVEAGKISMKLGGSNKSDYQTAFMFKDAGNLLKPTDVNGAIEAFKQAESIFIDGSKTYFNHGAQCKEAIGDIYFQLNQNDLAIQAYKLACTYYEADGLTYDKAKCYLKIGCTSEKEKLYDDVIIYSELYADIYTDKNYASITSIPILFGAIICTFALDDIVLTNKKMNEYVIRYVSFGKSSEYKFLMECMDAYNNGDSDFFLDIDKTKIKLSENQILILRSVSDQLKKQDDLC